LIFIVIIVALAGLILRETLKVLGLQADQIASDRGCET
jgi:hypothetical protein